MAIWRAAALILVALWGASLALPVNRGSYAWTDGLTWLMVGWLGFAVLQFGWIANILLWVGVIGLLKREPPTRNAGMILGGFMGALFLNTLSWRAVYSDVGSEPILAFGAGYYLWMTAVLLTGVCVFIRSRLGEEHG